MGGELIQFGPAEMGPATRVLSLSPAEALLLAPDHPFLQCGEWRAFAALEHGVLAARLVASIDSRQASGGSAVGCIGFVKPGDSGAFAASRHAGERALQAAVRWLRDEHVALVRCPVQLSTWYGHRAITSGFPDAGGAPPFLFEPRNDRTLVDLLLADGFLPAHRAVSLAVEPAAVIASARPALDRLDRAGLVDRPVRMSDLKQELRLLHRLSSEIFRAGWGFSGISFEEFEAIYRPLAAVADPELVRVVETADGHPVGFAFAMPDDPSTPGSGRFVVKTLGILPSMGRRYPGAGAGLTALVHRAACRRGYAGGIHALMTERGMAHRMSQRWGTEIRSYATFSRALP